MERKCSTCRAPAVYEIVGADPEKGNLACAQCRRTFWTISEAMRLDG